MIYCVVTPHYATNHMADPVPIRTTIRDNELVASRREHIARCAARIMVRKGFDKVSTQEIADACDMTIGSLYRYIGTKDDIIYLIMGQAIYSQKFCEDVAAFLSTATAREALGWAIDKYYRLIDEMQDEILFAYQETKNMNSDFRQVILQEDYNISSAFINILEHGHLKGEFVIDDTGLVADDIVVSAQMWAVRRWRLREKYTLDEYIKKRIELTMKIVGVDPGRD